MPQYHTMKRQNAVTSLRNRKINEPNQVYRRYTSTISLKSQTEIERKTVTKFKNYVDQYKLLVIGIGRLGNQFQVKNEEKYARTQKGLRRPNT